MRLGRSLAPPSWARHQTTVLLALAGLLSLVSLAFGLHAAESAAPPPDAPYRQADLPPEERLRDLLARMTLEEKVGQLNMPCVYEEGLGSNLEAKRQGCRNFAAGRHLPPLGPAGGFFTLPNTILPEGPRFQAEFLNELQRIATRETRLGIPLLLTEEGTHGLMCSGATIFPEGPALGSTWNLDLLGRVYTTIAREARAIGIHQIFTLVVEPIRDPRLGRNIEAWSEDPFLCGEIAATLVHAVQGEHLTAPDKVVAGLCHYPGQSQPVSGLERGAMEISERRLRATFLPPWEAGIRRAGALGVMATYPAVDGVPTHASRWILTDILRGELNFQGLVLSEGGGIGTLVYEGLAPSQKVAGQLALAAGVDVGISHESGYMHDLIESVREGAVPMAWVDRAVIRVLRQKLRLGLFERTEVDPRRAADVVHQPDHQALALAAAREGLVLLKNSGGLLPLRKDLRRLAVIGPNADNARNQLGDYTANVILQPIVTVLKGIQNAVGPATTVTYVKGCDVLGESLDQIQQAVEAARGADAAIVVVGENEWQARDAAGRPAGTMGEGFDSATLELTGLQERLVEAVAATGTPTVVVLINGRPLATRHVVERVPAILEAWLPGELGGQAVAEVLFGDVDPSGRLPVTVPRHVGQLPVAYDGPKSKRYWLEHGWGRRYADLEPTPLFPFGHGLSYTQFEYRNLRVEPAEITAAGSAQVTVEVQNTGQRPGQEVVQLYLEDVIASVATPVQSLRGFQKAALQPGETRTFTFTVKPEHFALFDQHGRRVIEPGEFRVLVGQSSADIRLRGQLVVK